MNFFYVSNFLKNIFWMAESIDAGPTVKEDWMYSCYYPVLKFKVLEVPADRLCCSCEAFHLPEKKEKEILRGANAKPGHHACTFWRKKQGAISGPN